jgi:glycosyltransferase involved in cell wall biosynthesis
LTIAGSGEEAYLENLKLKAKALMIDTKINWVGQVSNNDKFELLANKDLLVLTSHNENFANVVVESLYVGTPVCLSNEVGLSRYVAANDLGFTTSLDPQQITQVLHHAFLDHDKRQRIRLEAPSIIAKDFNEDELTQKYLKQYQQILHEA